MSSLYEALFIINSASMPPDEAFAEEVEELVFAHLLPPDFRADTRLTENAPPSICRKVFSKDDPVYRCRYFCH
jgi:hypothetical protein